MGNAPTDSIKRIWYYTAENDDLKSAIIFSFDVLLPPVAAERPIVVFGINEAEYACDVQLRGQRKSILEDTSEYNFRKEIAHPLARKSAKRATAWYNKVRWYVGETPVVLGELFFGSSRDLRHFRTRYQAAKSHLAFCRDRNLELIEHYNP